MQDDDSSDQEGFFKPILKIVKSEDEPVIKRAQEDGSLESANNLIYHARPTDYQARVLKQYSSLMYKPPRCSQLPEWCHHDGQQAKTELLIIKSDKPRKGKYSTLRDKYLNSQHYRLIYSKNQNSQEYNSSIFSLRHVSDYNPKDYVSAADGQLESTNVGEGKFESKFQSGNLSFAYEHVGVAVEEYDLVIQNDTNTRGYNQWFFFMFKNGSSKTVKFNIVNLVKKHSLFEEGVRPVAYSQRDKDKGWQPIGRNIQYGKSYLQREVGGEQQFKNYYCLSFIVDFVRSDDRIFMALNYPYTYSKMVNFLKELKPKSDSIIVQQSILTYTISNNAMPLLRIKHQKYEGRKKIVVMGRQHPGQTVSSYTFQGFIRSVLEDEKLLSNYEIVAIPMVNPDGVIYGNFRTNLSGFDLNRQWLEPDRFLHPQIFAIRKLLNSLKQISFVLDFHGHSKKYNSFIFACTGQPIYPFRVFPYIFSKQTAFFSIKDCTYNLTPDKERTARIQMFRQVNKPAIFTVQTSFFGYEDNMGKKWRWGIQDLYKIGQAAAESVRIYMLRRKELMAYEKEVKDKEYLFDQWAFQMRRDDIQSESNPSQDELTPIERKEQVMESKNKKRSKPPSKKKIKKPVEDELAILSKQQAQIESKRNLLFLGERKQSSKKNTGTVIVRKKVQRQKTAPFSQNKFKSKKVERAMSIITSKPPRPSLPSKKEQEQHRPPPLDVSITEPKQIKEWHNSSRQPNKQVPHHKRRQERQEQPEARVQTITSNLFSKPNFNNHFQKFREREAAMYSKTHSLEVNSHKKDLSFNISNIDILKKLILHQQEEIDSRTEKRRIGSYHVRDSRTIGSAAKMHQDNMKKNLEEEITNRTEALRNCQRKMNQISFQDGLVEHQEWQIPRAVQLTKSPKFPAIRGDRRPDYLNF